MLQERYYGRHTRGGPPPAAPKRKKKAVFWQPAFFFLSAVYFEVLLRLTAGIAIDARSFVYIVLFSAAYASVPAFLSLLSWGRKVNYVILALEIVLFCTEYFVYRSFLTFMDLASIFVGAGGVVGDFNQTLFQTIGKGIGVILLFALPFPVYIIMRKRLASHPRKGRAALSCVLALAVFFSAGLLAVRGDSLDKAKYGQQFEFSAACQRFGLLTALRLDTRYSVFGNPNASKLEVVELSEPLETEEPPSEEADGETDGETDGDEALEEPEPTSEPEYGYNIMDIDFAAINETVSSDAVRAMNDYISALSGSKQNEYTGLFEGKNLILITAEAFAAEVIDPELTPTLYRLATQGIQFTDYYQPAWGGSTSTGEYSNLIGLIPTDAVSSIQETIGYNMYFTLGNQLQRLGYFSAAYHNGTYTYYDRNKTHCNLGYSTFTGMGNGLELGVTEQWPESDLEMLEFTLQDYIDQQPFSIYYMTISGHCTYHYYGNSMTYKNWDAVADLDASDVVKGYYAANLELEYALEYLVEELEAAGIADDTVIVLATDHYPYGLEKSDTWANTEDYLTELYGYEADSNVTRDHSALIIWSGCLEDEGLELVVDTPTYSLDIVPTLSNLFGLEYDSRLLVGRDVFSDEEPLVIWRDYSWKTDKGYYDASTATFTPEEGVSVEQSYIDSINALVQNKYALSNVELNYDYYGILFGADDVT